jgi:hypothetical protein
MTEGGMIKTGGRAAPAKPPGRVRRQAPARPPRSARPRDVFGRFFATLDRLDPEAAGSREGA